MPTLNFSATYILYKYSNLLKECSSVLLECLTVLLESIDLFDTVDDTTQKNFEGAPLFKGSLSFLAFSQLIYAILHMMLKFG